MVNQTGDSWNTLESELIYLHTKLSEFGFIYVGGEVVYPGLENHDV